MKHATFLPCQSGIPTPPHIKAEIVCDYQAGATRREITSKFGCSKGTLYKVLKEYGVQMRGQTLLAVPEERVEAVRKLWEQGRTTSQAAAELGITRNAVAGIIHRHEISRDAAVNAANHLRAVRENGRKSGNFALGRLPSVKRTRKPRDPSAQKPAAYKIGVTGHVYTMPPTVDLPRFTGATLGSTPKPWTERLSGECTWPVSGEGADTFSCCAPVVQGGWCEEHARTGFNNWRSNKGGYHAEPKSFVAELVRRFAA